MTYYAGETKGIQQTGKQNIEIDGDIARKIRTEARVSTLIRSRYFGEYLLPYGIAVVLVASVVVSVVIGRCGGQPT